METLYLWLANDLLLESYPEGLLHRRVWVTAKTKPEPIIWEKVFVWEVVSGSQWMGEFTGKGKKPMKYILISGHHCLQLGFKSIVNSLRLCEVYFTFITCGGEEVIFLLILFSHWLKIIPKELTLFQQAIGPTSSSSQSHWSLKEIGPPKPLLTSRYLRYKTKCRILLHWRSEWALSWVKK